MAAPADGTALLTRVKAFDTAAEHNIEFLDTLVYAMIMIREQAESDDARAWRKYFASGTETSDWAAELLGAIAGNGHLIRYMVSQGVDPMQTLCWCALRSPVHQRNLVRFLQHYHDRTQDAQAYVSGTFSENTMRVALGHISEAANVRNEFFALPLCLWLNDERVAEHADDLYWESKKGWSRAEWQKVRADSSEWLGAFEQHCLGPIHKRVADDARALLRTNGPSPAPKKEDALLETAIVVLTLYLGMRPACGTRAALTEALVARFGGIKACIKVRNTAAFLPYSVHRLATQVALASESIRDAELEFL